MGAKYSLTKSQKNYCVDIAALVPFIFLLFTGVIMLMYHTGTPKSENILSRDGYFWLNTHIVFAFISFVIIILHLILHLNWFKKLFSAKRKNKYWFRNLMLVILFVATALTSFTPLLIMDESTASSMILGIHNKFGLLLIAFFLIHFLSYSKWLFSMTQKVFMKNTNKEVRNERV